MFNKVNMGCGVGQREYARPGIQIQPAPDLTPQSTRNPHKSKHQ